MRTVDNLSDALIEKGVVCISIRAPKGDGGWIANTRIDDSGWKCGEPAETLEEALLNVLWIPNAPEAVRSVAPRDKWHDTTHMAPIDDDMEDLLG